MPPFIFMELMYNFKRNTKLYLVELNNPGGVYKHRLDVYADISASQTFDEQSVPKRTLHRPGDIHAGAVIYKANAANFSFTTPLFNYSTISYPVLFSLAADISSDGTIDYFDLYLETDTELFRIEKAVVESLTFNLERNEVITFSISGSAKKLYRGLSSVPGTLVTDTQTYTSIKKMTATINSNVVDSIAAINMEFQNEIQWVKYDTIHKTLEGNICYPEEYRLINRTVSGSITQFLTSDNVTDFSDNSITEPLTLDVYTGLTESPALLSFDLPSTVYTRRFDIGQEIITRVYDFRLNSNSENVKPIYKGV